MGVLQSMGCGVKQLCAGDEVWWFPMPWCSVRMQDSVYIVLCTLAYATSHHITPSAGLGVEYVDVAQVLVPGLEERSRFFPRLESSHQVTPGYFDAPATTIAPLSTFACLNRPLYPAVTLVFCAIERCVGCVWGCRGLRARLCAVRT